MPRHDASVRFAFFDATDCGISEFAERRLTGIGGQIKTVHEDFCVTEVRVGGELVPSPEWSNNEVDGGLPPQKRRRLGQPTDVEVWPESLKTAVTVPAERAAVQYDADDAEQGQWTLVQLRKRGLDTLESVAQIAQALGVGQSRIRFAGIKDSVAVTVQDVMLRNVEPHDIESAVANMPWLALSAPTAVPRRAPLLRPGYSAGNFFRVRVRQPSITDTDAVAAHFTSLRDLGFVNYVGLQRFGKGGVRADIVGMHYLRRDYERAVDAILCPDEEVGYRQRSWVEVWRRTNNPTAALRAGCGPSAKEWVARELLVAMQTVLRTMAGADWADFCRAAFMSLPSAVRTLFAHSYFDRLWNIAASHRIRRHGLVAVTGDLIARPTSDGRPGSPEVLREGEAASIHEVVLPLPGAGIQFPAHSSGGLMHSFMAYDGLAPDVARELTEPERRIADRNPAAARGAYRRLVASPLGLRWRVHNGSVECAFQLRTGQYATMMLRELLEKRPPQVPRRVVFDSDSESD